MGTRWISMVRSCDSECFSEVRPSVSWRDLVPDMLFQPVATKSLDKILRDPIGIKNLNAHRLKLGLVSCNLWLSSPHIPECHHFFLFSARSLFQQIILAHEKSFESEICLKLESIFFSAQVCAMTMRMFMNLQLAAVLTIGCYPHGKAIQANMGLHDITYFSSLLQEGSTLTLSSLCSVADKRSNRNANSSSKKATSAT
ncbi:hypothetical protein Tco_0339650 [Tanacetum coccineum]